MAVFDRSMTVEPEPLGATAVEEEKGLEATPEWGPVKRVLFRFAFSYLFLYLFTTFLGLLAIIPYAYFVVGWYFRLWAAIVPWAGQHLFQTTAAAHPTGSGDSMYSWVEVFCYLALAVLATVVWTALDGKRKSYPRLYEALRVYVRFGLGVTMISYGAFKVIPSQFPPPSLDRLLQSIGDSSPMGILWTFMGVSTPYNVFAGLTEFVGGALLLFRRTMRVGALVCIAAMTNVVLLNFCYDVPVKQYSAHLLAMAIFLAAPDLRRLADLLVFNRPVAPAVDRPLLVSRKRWLRPAVLAWEVVFFLVIAAFDLNISYEQYKAYHDVSSLPLHGIWNVDELAFDGQARPPAMTDASRWRYVVFDYTNLFSIVPMDNTRLRYFMALDTAKKTFSLTKRDDPAWKSTLSYQEPAPGSLLLEGSLDGKKVRATLHRIEPPAFTLKTRGFHWVSEYPFNH
jgi:hypothetical protein